MSLTEELAARKARSAQKTPPEKYAIMMRATQELKDAELSKGAKGVGDTLPDVTLTGATGESVTLSDLWGQGPLVISFYRGGWCPYCNMELRALKTILPQLKEQNARLVAISPETPDHSLDTREKNELAFPVLSDIDNVYAKALGLVFQMPTDLQEHYHNNGLHVDQHNGNDEYELPMPATYVVDQSGKVLEAFVPEDYTERLDPENILKALATETIG
ncbi:MAG TPA: alkyl hydroperoxide reductase [Cytophagales bacterium]|nr:alkyl hydroperoxide reductase [Cytophagales bacterium]HAA23190.1 alkyl hydroperoxide reductase [Cytophagales bacterium]HAP59310.1 alkyl hydroperoxide reductase [Cytophagales bacterium]